eukprot:scaffold516671_cov24-Prasinocladus_malaysianus.AAC.1
MAFAFADLRVKGRDKRFASRAHLVIGLPPLSHAAVSGPLTAHLRPKYQACPPVPVRVEPFLPARAFSGRLMPFRDYESS